MTCSQGHVPQLLLYSAISGNWSFMLAQMMKTIYQTINVLSHLPSPPLRLPSDLHKFNRDMIIFVQCLQPKWSKPLQRPKRIKILTNSVWRERERPQSMKIKQGIDGIRHIPETLQCIVVSANQGEEQPCRLLLIGISINSMWHRPSCLCVCVCGK